jgi:hypothetical protein
VGGVHLCDLRHAFELVWEWVDALLAQAFQLGPAVVHGVQRYSTGRGSAGGDQALRSRPSRLLRRRGREPPDAFIARSW